MANTRDRVRAAYARLVAHVERISQAEPERIDEFFRYGMWLNVAAAMGVEDLSVVDKHHLTPAASHLLTGE